MKTFLTITLLIIGTSLQGFSCDFHDSVKVDKKKTEAIIKEIKRRHLDNYHKIEKDFALSEVEFVYPDKFVALDDFDFDIDVKWKGQTILMCDVEVVDEKYNLGLIIDLR
jgi:hypothetical protein